MNKPNYENTFVYVGTYTQKENEGIYVYRLNSSTGALDFASNTIGGINHSFLAVDPQQRYLYATNEVDELDGHLSGAITAFSIDATSGELTYLNRMPSRGTIPCHLNVDKTGRFLFVVNYGSGSVSVFPIEDDGQLGATTDFVQHRGSSVNPKRQQGPHTHSINLDIANRYAFVPDLGLDKIMIYKLDLSRGKIIPNEEPYAQITPGAGPRHFSFHPSGKYAYVINELDSTLTAFTYDETRGTLTNIQTASTVPNDFYLENTCADIHVSPSGQFVYGSNRGHGSIVIFSIDENTGKLTYVDHQSTQGKIIRNFAIDQTGAFLFVANQDTNKIVTFRIDQQTGKLEETSQIVEVPAPTCLKLVPITL